MTGAERHHAQRALSDKNTELQHALDAKIRFLANMSHELRTPLNGILGFAEFLVDGKPGTLNPKQKEYLEDISNSGKHLLELTSLPPSGVVKAEHIRRVFHC